MDQYIGKLLDNRYEIQEVIGAGGMAVVYKAYCHRLHRFVAIKILRNDLAADSDFKRRFHDEAQAVAMLSHPNIVSVYDVGSSDNLEYIVMELIDGITLKQYMQKKGGNLSWRESLHYITQIMRALSHAHSRGIIHRDIKPQNIMILRDGSVRVADFGIARIMSAAQRTLTQEAIGSVHYISPEQAKGSHIDARADIYSAGVVLYEMLTGRLPFEGDSPVSVAIQHISSVPLAPRELNPEIPEGLETITLKAMSSNLDRRYKSADDMISDLETFRKNPNAVFAYGNMGTVQGVDDATQKIDKHRVREMGAQEPDAVQERRARRPSNTKKKKGPAIAIAAVAALAVLLLIWLFFSNLFNRDTGMIPDLRGKTVEEVEKDSKFNEKFEIRVEDEPVASEQKEGTIAEQTPKEKTKITDELERADDEDKDSKIIITVTLSSGPEEQVMPDVTGMTFNEAKKQLEDMGLGLRIERKTEKSNAVDINKVIRSKPKAGELLAEGDTVQLIISDGQEDNKVKVPAVEGLTQSRAEQELKDFGLQVRVTEVNSSEEKGLVTSQSILPNTRVEKGTTVTIQVSKGPAEPTPPDPTPSESSKNITVDLQDFGDKETVKVVVTVDGQQQYNKTVNVIESPLSIKITGKGTQRIIVTVDDREIQNYVETF